MSIIDGSSLSAALEMEFPSRRKAVVKNQFVSDDIKNCYKNTKWYMDIDDGIIIIIIMDLVHSGVN